MLKTTALLLVACALLGAAHARARDTPSSVDLEDANLDVPELIVKYGYPVEVHDVTTSDGYILQLHRIPHGRDDAGSESRPIVFLMHGLLSSSADWIIMGPGKGLGYILADEGFDVWLGNARGNFYSRRHISLNPNLSGFWDFSWDEIGSIDLAASIDHVLAYTGRDALHYIGHSQGTTTFLVLTSLKPEYNAKFKNVHLMAPVAYMKHLDSPMLLSLASHSSSLATLGAMLGLSELFPRGSTFEYVDGETRCIESYPLASLCEQFIDAFTGQSLDQFNAEMMPVILAHTPSGSSLKQFAHYGQVVDNQLFRRWNFVLALQNRLVYGTSPAPSYDLSLVTARVNLHYSIADALTPEADVQELNEVLADSSLHLVQDESFTHFDFAWGTEARATVYDIIIKTMREVEAQ